MATSLSSSELNPMIHRLEHPVQIFDTDCYGVMWHGAYAKWLEMGRVGLCQQLGIELSKPGEGLVFPVIDQHLRFRASVTFGDTLLIESQLHVEGCRLLFTQMVRNQATQAVVVEAKTIVVLVDQKWQLLKRIPEAILQKLV